MSPPEGASAEHDAGATRVADRRARLERAFDAHFGPSPHGARRALARAPGRIDLMGSHTDYNGGAVLALAIDLDTWALAAPRGDGRVRVHSLALDATVDAPLEGDALSALSGARTWGRYVFGVARACLDDGIACAGFDAVVDGRVPLGSGLSSSAALEVATALVVEALAERDVPEAADAGHAGAERAKPAADASALARALRCQRAENRYVGVACGVLDPYCAVFGRAGRALAIDCRALAHREVALPRSLAIVVGDTRAPRALAASAYGERRAQCEAGAAHLAAARPGVRDLCDVPLAAFERLAPSLPPLVARRCRFALEEHARVAAAADALERDDRGALAAHFAASFAGARDLYSICIPEMEAMEAAMRAAPGCVGARQAGAGFGGCLVALVERDRVDAFAAHAARAYARASGREGALFPVEAADGASLLA
ncbi:MAG: galactokinase family protein [Myxococcota bacterium]